jgi:hypothetical protein
MWQMKHDETTCCDLGHNSFSISSSPNSKGCFITQKFTDLTCASFNWISTLRELPDIVELNRVNRKNSFRASNFPILMMGDLVSEADFWVRKVLRLRQVRFVALHGTRLVIFHAKGADMTLIDINQFTSVTRKGPATFILYMVDGEVAQWRCKSTADRESWAEHIQSVIDRDLMCAFRHKRRI